VVIAVAGRSRRPATMKAAAIAPSSNTNRPPTATLLWCRSVITMLGMSAKYRPPNAKVTKPVRAGAVNEPSRSRGTPIRGCTRSSRSRSMRCGRVSAVRATATATTAKMTR
jgi:hypothetical protein